MFIHSLFWAQALHLLAVKTRAVSVWDHGPLSSNIMMVYGVLVALGIMLFIVYVPGVRACARHISLCTP